MGVSEGKSAQKPRFCAREEQIAWEKGLLGVNKFPYPFGSHYNPDCVSSELALTALFLSAYISKIVFFGNSRIFVKILYIGVRIFYGFVGQWIP